MHEFKSWIVHAKPLKMMFRSKIKSNSRVWVKREMEVKMSWSCGESIEVMFGNLMKNALGWIRSDEQDRMWSSWSVFMLFIQNFGLRRKFCLEMGVRSFLAEKYVFVLSHTGSSLTLQMKMAQMRPKGKKWGLI